MSQHSSRYNPTAASNIRVSVTFDSPTVFAGEDVACTITFKNISRDEHQQGSRTPSPQYNNGAATLGSRKVTPIQPQGRAGASRQASYGQQASGIPAHMRKVGGGGAGHRLVNSVGRVGDVGAAEGLGLGGMGSGASKPRHGRSLSIMSMGTDAGTVVSVPRDSGSAAGRSVKGGHERTISAQTAPRRSSAGRHDSSTGQSSPRVGAPVITEQDMDPHATIRPKRPTQKRPLSEAKKSPGILHQDFRFPAAPPDDAASPLDPESAISPKTESLPFRALSPPVLSSLDSSANPISRVLSQSSVNDSSSPRSSLDLFSEAMSTHSDETYVSEYVQHPTSHHQANRLLPTQRPQHVRTNSRLGVREPPRGPETLMMGYAQIMGSFTLEGSLVNQAPFEDLKRKAIVGSHGGGGVVGVERTSKRDSGLFGAFGWSNIGESLGGLLGGNELSSIKEMGRMASSKAIPLVTTPPSILFVDLKLKPGEKKAFRYRFQMPRGLPPSFRGRAIKVVYQLVVGTQRSAAGKGKEQQVKSVEVPFRVFGSIDSTGDVLGHDLMAPYILLRDQARTESVSGVDGASKPDVKPKKPPDHDGELDFKTYISVLLDKSNSSTTNGFSGGLLSPNSPLASPTHALHSPSLSYSLPLRRQSSLGEAPSSQRELIDLAILRSTHLSSDSSKSNGAAIPSNLNTKFNISRSQHPIATVHLPRPSYRLGETIPLLVTFPTTSDLKSQNPGASGAIIPTYAIQVALETRETVDPAIAMRSPSSIYRYTRKVHAYDAASAMYARRLTFRLHIPSTGVAPEFVTSGVGLEWRIRVEFVTPRMGDGEGAEGLLEEVAEDERGVLVGGVEGVRVETFEIAVPIRVYAAVGVGERSGDVEDLPI